MSRAVFFSDDGNSEIINLFFELAPTNVLVSDRTGHIPVGPIRKPLCC
jgi:hypothetical protein